MKRIGLSLLGITLLGLMMVVVGYYLLPLAYPLPTAIVRPLPSTELLSREGRHLGFLADENHYRQQPLPADEAVPPFIKEALLIAEDKRFDQHGGVDFLAMGRALRDAVQAGKVVSGASTISMQLAKMGLPLGGRTVARKVEEILIARHWELIFDKETILRAYLNHADFGQLCRGIETAARVYFDCHARDLREEQLALLLVQLRSPTYYNPLKHPERALAARDQLLQRMGRGDLVGSPLGLQRPQSWRLPHLSEKAGTLCLSADLQEMLERAVQQEVASLQAQNVQQGAAILLDNHTGEVLASVASAQWADPRGGQLDGTSVRRSAGSTLKPFVYLLALQAGRNPSSIYADLPTPMLSADGIAAPRNYNDKYLGPISMKVALASSQNIPAMLALNEHGGERALLLQLHDLGYDLDEGEYGLGLAIGNAHVQLKEQAAAFCCLARGGSYLPLRFHQEEEPQAPRQLMAAEHAWQITDMLSDPQARVAGFGFASTLRFPFPCAVKTGTSSNFRDNWCVGYTGDYTLAVWVGNFDNSPMDEVSGLTGAGPIFHRVMMALHENAPSPLQERPEGMQKLLLDTRTGYVGGGGTQEQWMTEEQALIASEGGDYDEQGRALLAVDYKDWLASQGEEVQRQYAIDPQRGLRSEARIINPPYGVKVYLDPHLPDGGRVLPLKSTMDPDQCQWSSPSLRLFKRLGQWYAWLEEGDHLLKLEDLNGEEKALTRFEVVD